MTGFVKLYGSILDSTVWREDGDTRLVWITMLAMADAQGYVEASIPGLADRARVTLAACEHALERLMLPDRYSRTKDHGGRRIVVVEGGWMLLNHTLYRERRTESAVRMARKRQRDAANKAAVTCDDVTTEAEADLGAARRGNAGGLTVFSSEAQHVARSKIAGAREASEPPAPTRPQPPAIRTTFDAAAFDPRAPAVTTTRAGRTYVGRLASDGERFEVDMWRRTAMAALPVDQRRRVPGFTSDIAELGPGIARALDAHGSTTVRDVVAWATVECGAGRLSPRHYRALFNGDSFDQRVIEAAAHVAGEAPDLHTVDPALASAIVDARTSVAQWRTAIETVDDDLRPTYEQQLERAEAKLAELLGQSRKPNGATHAHRTR